MNGPRGSLLHMLYLRQWGIVIALRILYGINEYIWSLNIQRGITQLDFSFFHGTSSHPWI
jgi:hypothetical protein